MMHSSYFETVAKAKLDHQYPVGKEFVDRIATIDRAALRDIQNARFMILMKRAWQIPFYKRLWEAKGIEPGDIRTVEDLPRLPTFAKTDLMESIADFPPLGDFHGIESFGSSPENRPPVILHTTSGTTGSPQPLLFGPVSRELQNRMLARVYLLFGLGAKDLVHSVYGFGTVNAGHYTREAILHYTNAMLLTPGTGAETRSQSQVRMMRDFHATVLVGFADYLRHLAGIAREEGIEPGKDIQLRAIFSHLGGESRQLIADAWKCPLIVDHYGTGETGVVCSEGPDRDGMYIWEDAHVVEILDAEGNEPVQDGQTGTITVTCLFKNDVFPVVRYNTKDLSVMMQGSSPSGWTLRRLKGFLGRSDNMIKLRGINVYPTAIGELLKTVPETNGEFFCRVIRKDSRDDMVVAVESSNPTRELESRLKDLFRKRIGVDLIVKAVSLGSLAVETEMQSRQKPIRLRDLRNH